MRLPLFLLASFLFTHNTAFADRLDDAITAEMKRRHVQGVSVVVIKDGKVVREKGYGMANVEHNVPVTPQTQFQSASVGKQFTAALVLLLAEDGKLKLTDPISRHLENTPKEWEGITIHHLLTHTSGLGDPYAKLDLRKDYTDEELIALYASIPMLFAPGAKWSYSNMGYHLLGFICNKVGGKFYGDQLRERIFAPLGMSTRVISEADIVPHRSSGYEWTNGKIRHQDWVAPRLNTTADGSLFLTARDLALWDQALYGNKILNERLREVSWTPVKLNDGTTSPYGYGWALSPHNGHRNISHSGAWQGFRTQINRFVDDRLTVIVLANTSSAKPWKIADMVAAHYVPALAPVQPKAIEDTEPSVTARVRSIMADLARGTVPSGLSDDLANRYTPKRVESYAEQVREWGALEKIELLKRPAEGEPRRYSYRVKLKNDTVVVNLGLGKADQIDALGISLQ